MNEMIKIFEFEGANVRIQDRNGDPWFVLADVCKAIDLSDPASASRRLDPEEKDTLDLQSLSIGNIRSDDFNSLGSVGTMPTIINESGLYSLILTSRKPEAKRFKKWVTGAVLPSIRKHGAYIAEQEHLSDAELVAKALIAAVRINEERAKRIEALESENAVFAPKAEALDRISASEGSCNLQRAGKEIFGRANAIFPVLQNLKWIFRRGGGQWEAYQTQIDAGTLENRHVDTADGKAHMQTLITPKGCARLAEIVTKVSRSFDILDGLTNPEVVAIMRAAVALRGAANP